MRTKELLLECKVKLKVSSDYALGKALKISDKRISEYMRKKCAPTPYALARIADCLGLDPLGLIAEYEEASAKNEIERSFWADFQQRVKQPLKGFILALLCALSLSTGLDLTKTHGGVFRRLKYA